jgi:hypothetical protein
MSVHPSRLHLQESREYVLDRHHIELRHTGEYALRLLDPVRVQLEVQALLSLLEELMDRALSIIQTISGMFGCVLGEVHSAGLKRR